MPVATWCYIASTGRRLTPATPVVRDGYMLLLEGAVGTSAAKNTSYTKLN